jgi:hypothetical protein
MNFRLSSLVALVCSAAFTLPAAGQSVNIKPGLWEVTNNMATSDGRIQSAIDQMQKQLARMDPAERKQMEQIFAEQGVKMGSGGSTVSKACVTPEMARRRALPLQQQGDCTQALSGSQASRMTFTFSCTNPRITGDGEATFTGDTGYQVNGKVSSSGGAMTFQQSGKWLAPDCGDLQPDE